MIEDAEFLHAQIDFTADPGVRGGVDDLLLGQVLPSPVGALSAFGDANTEEVGGEVAQAVGGDPAVAGLLPEIEKPILFEGPQFFELPDVVVDRDPDLHHLGVGEKAGE